MFNLKEKKLNLGCGVDVLEGYVNLDKYPYPRVDVVCDLDLGILPFEDDEFDYVKAENILEHLDYKLVLVELARIMKKNGFINIRVPHFTSRDVYADPTHKYGFSVKALKFFVIDDREQNEKYNFRKFRVLECIIEFEKRPAMFWNYFIEMIVNINDSTREYYERSILRFFPAEAIRARLIK